MFFFFFVCFLVLINHLMDCIGYTPGFLVPVPLDRKYSVVYCFAYTHPGIFLLGLLAKAKCSPVTYRQHQKGVYPANHRKKETRKSKASKPKSLIERPLMSFQ